MTHRKGIMPEAVKKVASVTILSFFSTSILMGTVGFFLKNTIDKLDTTMDKVNQREVEMATFNTTIIHLGKKLDKLDNTVSKTGTILSNYTKIHASNLSQVTISITKIVDKVDELDRRSDRLDSRMDNCGQDIKECEDEYRSIK